MTEPGLDHYSTNCKDTLKVNYLQQTEDGNKEKVDISNHPLDLRYATANQNSRYVNTFKVFQQTGLLDCTLQTAKLIKENEKLQEKINELQRKVNKAAQKTALDLSSYQKRLAMQNKMPGGVSDGLSYSSDEIRPSAFKAQAKMLNVSTLYYTKAGTLTSRARVNALGTRLVSRTCITEKDCTVIPNKSNLCRLDLTTKLVSTLDTRPSNLPVQDVKDKPVTCNKVPGSSLRPDPNLKPVVVSDATPSNLPKPDSNIKVPLSDVRGSSDSNATTSQSLDTWKLPALISDSMSVSSANSVTHISDSEITRTNSQNPPHVINVCSNSDVVEVAQLSSTKEVKPNSNGLEAACNKEKTKEHL